MGKADGAVSEARQGHWERVYRSKLPTEVSWYQPVPERSLEFVRATGLPLTAPMLDVGGGASTLVDHLLGEGYEDLTVLDIASSALERARARLGDLAARVNWIEADITHFRPTRAYALWHDRAVFHFLTDPEDRARYLAVLRRALAPAGHVVLATFGPEGPTRCSGLPVQRYALEELGALLGPRLTLRRHRLEEHDTPMGTRQQFLYGWWQAADCA